MLIFRFIKIFLAGFSKIFPLVFWLIVLVGIHKLRHTLRGAEGVDEV